MPQKYYKLLCQRPKFHLRTSKNYYAPVSNIFRKNLCYICYFSSETQIIFVVNAIWNLVNLEKNLCSGKENNNDSKN